MSETPDLAGQNPSVVAAAADAPAPERDASTLPAGRWLLAAAVFGLAAQYLFWGWPRYALGLNVFLVTALGLGLVVALATRERVPRGTWPWLGLTLLWAVLFAWRAQAALRFWLGLAWAVSLAAALLAYNPGDAWQSTWVGWLLRLGEGFVAWLRGPVEALREVLRGVTLHRAWKAVALGLVLLLPVLLCFVPILATADPVFARWWERFFAWETLWRWLARLVWTAFFAWWWLALAAVAWYSRPRPQGLGHGALPAVSVAVVLGGVATLFAAFLAVQARFLFADDAALQAYGLTHAEYAREGFGQLVVVAVLTWLLLMVLDALRRAPEGRGGRWVQALGGVLVLEVLLLLASAAYRLGLYVQTYAWTATRLLVAVFMAWLALVLLGVLWEWLRPAPHRWPRWALLLLLGMTATYAVLGPADFIVRRNLRRAARPLDVDTFYLVVSEELGPGRWVPLERALDDPAIAEEVRQHLGAVIACYIVELREGYVPYGLGMDEARPDWRFWVAERMQGEQAWLRLKARVLQAYPTRQVVIDDGMRHGYPTHQVSIDGQWRRCDTLLYPPAGAPWRSP